MLPDAWSHHTESRKTTSSGSTTSQIVIATTERTASVVTSNREDVRTTGWASRNECRSAGAVGWAIIGRSFGIGSWCPGAYLRSRPPVQRPGVQSPAPRCIVIGQLVGCNRPSGSGRRAAERRVGTCADRRPGHPGRQPALPVTPTVPLERMAELVTTRSTACSSSSRSKVLPARRSRPERAGAIRERTPRAGPVQLRRPAPPNGSFMRCQPLAPTPPQPSANHVEVQVLSSALSVSAESGNARGTNAVEHIPRRVDWSASPAPMTEATAAALQLAVPEC